MYPTLHHPSFNLRWWKVAFVFIVPGALLFTLLFGMAWYSSVFAAPVVQPTVYDCGAVSEIPHSECNALVALYNSAGGLNWVTQTNWLKTGMSPCSWYQVNCMGGRVIGIQLIDVKLTGTLSSEIYDLTQLDLLYLCDKTDLTYGIGGSLSPNIGKLIHLKTLAFCGPLKGVIPPEIGALPNLMHLSLRNTLIDGPLPTELGTLTNLVGIDIRSSDLDGGIPPQIGNLANLQTFFLSAPKVDGPIPAQIANLTNLTTLWLNTNNSKTIPEGLGNLSSLQTLFIDSPSISGVLPKELGQLSNLRSLHIENTQITGAIPPALGNLTNMIALQLSNNRLFDPLPPELGHLSHLSELSLGNNQLSGEIPPALANLSFTLTRLSINHNMFTATDPAVREMLEQLNPYWQNTQTVPPTDMRVRAAAATTVTLDWTPIVFIAGTGSYDIGYSTTPDEIYTQTVSTTSKQDASVTVKNLCPSTTYYFGARTSTAPHDAQQNYLHSPFSSAVSVTTLPRTMRLLSLYMLALDSNLDAQYNALVQGIAEATKQNTNEFAVILADRQGLNNTQILLAECGHVTPVEGLPDPETGQWNLELKEYNMTDPATLSAFIRWARDNFGAASGAANEKPKTVLSYLGHGVPLAPATDVARYISQTIESAASANLTVQPSYLPPAPTKIPATPDQLTDETSLSLISPYSLTMALSTATNNGEDPITVLDIVHCFGGTIEEFYELSNPQGKPVAETMVGSPNYTYAGPTILSNAMLAVDPSQPATQMATSIVQGYEAALAEADTYDDNPDVNHPRIIVAVDSSKMRALKENVDNLASALITEFTQNSATTNSTKDKLSAAQQASTHYDTTTCDLPERKEDFTLSSEDGLADLADFAAQLHNQFPTSLAVMTTTEAILNVGIPSAIIKMTKANGTPWFANDPNVFWNFDNARGIAIYTDLHGITLNNQQYIGWQAHWYTSTVSSDNVHPYAFTQGNTTWPNVLSRFWGEQFGGDDGVRTIGCMAKLPEVRLRQLYLPVIQR